MERIASAPFTFQDIESWILFSVGVLFRLYCSFGYSLLFRFLSWIYSDAEKLDVAREQYNDEYSGSIGISKISRMIILMPSTK